LHHAISPFSELHNNDLLYLLWHSNLRVKKCAPSLFNSLQSDEAWQERPQQTETATPTQTAVSHQVYLHALLFQHLYSVFFQVMDWWGPASETAWMQRSQTHWLKYTDFTELKKITRRIYSNCSNYSSLFASPSNVVAVCFVSLKKCTVNCTSVLLILFFTSCYIFQRKSKSGIFGGFYCFF